MANASSSNSAHKVSRPSRRGEAISLTVPAGSRSSNETDKAEREDIFSHILSLQPNLSRAHKVVAQAILAHPQDFVEKPIEDLTSWLGLSAPTVTRFCRSVGCEGLRDLKLKIMGGLRVGLRYLEPLGPPGSTAEAIERAQRRAELAMDTALRTLDKTVLERAADAVGRARTLYVFGSGGVSSWLIEEIQNRLFRLGIPVTISADHQMQMMLAATVKKADVVLFCSLTGRNAELLRSASIAAQYGATTLALTTDDTPLSQAVALPLTLQLSDPKEILFPTSMRYGFLVVIDVLSYLVAQRSGRVAQETMRRIKQQFVTFRDTDDTAPLCD